MKNKYSMIVLPLLFVLSTCGYNNSTQTSGTGSISFGVEWVGGPERAPAAAGIYRAPLDCTAAGVATVEAALYATNPQNTLNLIASGGPWDCNAHTGDMTVSTPQNGATLGIMGKNAAGGVVYYGEQGNIFVSQNQTTDVGVITASYVVPSGLTALAGSSKNLISWSSVTSATAYNLYWSLTPSVTPASGTKIAVATSPSLSYAHTSVTNGTTYYYIVTAMRGSTESAGSNEVSAKPIAGATMPVTGATTLITETTATLNGSFENPNGYSTSAWFESGQTTAYENASTTHTNYGQVGPLNHTANLTGLFQNTTYHYRLATQNTGGTFYGADKTFTTNRAITNVATTTSNPRVLAIDADSVFWTEHNNFGGAGTGSVNMVSKLGGTVITLATNTAAANTRPFGIAVDGNNVYWTDSALGTVNKVSKGGPGTVTTLAANLNTPQFIAVDPTNPVYVYWTESVGGTVKKADINTGLTTTLAQGLGSPMGIAVDDANIYWTESTGGMVKKKAKSDGTETIIA
jgi:hypothetical protein